MSTLRLGSLAVIGLAGLAVFPGSLGAAPITTNEAAQAEMNAAEEMWRSPASFHSQNGKSEWGSFYGCSSELFWSVFPNAKVHRKGWEPISCRMKLLHPQRGWVEVNQPWWKTMYHAESRSFHSFGIIDWVTGDAPPLEQGGTQRSPWVKWTFRKWSHIERQARFRLRLRSHKRRIERPRNVDCSPMSTWRMTCRWDEGTSKKMATARLVRSNGAVSFSWFRDQPRRIGV